MADAKTNALLHEVALGEYARQCALLREAGKPDWHAVPTGALYASLMHWCGYDADTAREAVSVAIARKSLLLSGGDIGELTLGARGGIAGKIPGIVYGLYCEKFGHAARVGTEMGMLLPEIVRAVRSGLELGRDGEAHALIDVASALGMLRVERGVVKVPLQNPAEAPVPQPACAPARPEASRAPVAHCAGDFTIADIDALVREVGGAEIARMLVEQAGSRRKDVAVVSARPCPFEPFATVAIGAGVRAYADFRTLAGMQGWRVSDLCEGNRLFVPSSGKSTIALVAVSLEELGIEDGNRDELRNVVWAARMKGLFACPAETPFQFLLQRPVDGGRFRFAIPDGDGADHAVATVDFATETGINFFSESPRHGDDTSFGDAKGTKWVFRTLAVPPSAE